MNKFGYSTPEATIDFVLQHNIDIETDREALPDYRFALLAQLDEAGSTVRHIQTGGADYYFSQLDYLDRERKLCASRMIANILAGQRTDLAYWTQAAPQKKLTIHQGEGCLVMARPSDGSTHSFRLDPVVTPAVNLPSGVFYTLEADKYTSTSLVVSGLYLSEVEVDWDVMEVPLVPGQKQIDTDEGLIEVPDNFRARFS